MKTQRTPSLSTLLSVVCALTLVAGATAPSFATPAMEGGSKVPFPVVARFENFGEKDGIPGHKIHSVLRASDGKLWIGTSDGLCVRLPDGKFKRYGREDGLSHPTVLHIAEDPATGDLWLATMQGLSRFSGGQFTAFTQTNSGLPNNVVYAVAITGDTVWAATAAGAGAYDTKAKNWKIYDQNNTVMEEPWCYAIAPAEKLIYLGVWAGGVVEHDPKTGSFKAYRDPDGDFQLQLMPDSGPVADITSWLAYDRGIIWQATYFGMSRYDTKLATWKTWVQDKSPLVSNFINTLFAHDGVAWVCTDRGVSVTNGNYWVNYLVDEQGRGVIQTCAPGRQPETRIMTTALADGFVLAAWADAHEVWFATSNGLSHGIFAEPSFAAPVAVTP